MSKLKPCPFCGQPEPFHYWFDPYDGYQGDCSQFVIRCTRCTATMTKKKEEEAVEAWNRRADTPKGRWIQRRFVADGSTAYLCSECHTTWDAESNYCPNCGAEMGGEA